MCKDTDDEDRSIQLDTSCVDSENKMDRSNLGCMAHQAMRVARWRKTYFWVGFAICVACSIMGFMIGEFEIVVNNIGWWSRGTERANRQAQVDLVIANRKRLAAGKVPTWEDLINGTQVPQEAQQDDSRRLGAEESNRMYMNSLGIMGDEPNQAELEEFVEYLKSLQNYGPSSRSLEETLDENATFVYDENRNRLDGCDTNKFFGGAHFGQVSLWAIWEVKDGRSALEPEVLHEMCVSEENTQKVLMKHGLCSGCDNGYCLPPFSPVLYARTIVKDGLELNCSGLVDTWISGGYEERTKESFQKCTESLLSQQYISIEGFPLDCPPSFFPTMVDRFFADTEVAKLSASVFYSQGRRKYRRPLYEAVDEYDRGSDLIDGVYDTSLGDFGTYYANDSMDRVVTTLAAISLGFATLAIIIHTKSLFLTFIGVLVILLSFPLAFFFYKIVIQYEFFPFFNFIGVFVVFTLGAHHVFVVVDKWKNHRNIHPQWTTEEIAAWALPDALAAMFVTTSTTAAAFFATAICPVVPIKLFGTFCGLIILTDFLANVLLLFPCVCIYDGFRGQSNILISFLKAPATADEDEPTLENTRGYGSSVIHLVLEKYFDLLHRFRWVVLGVSTILLAVCIYFSTTVELPILGEVRLLDSSVEYEQFYERKVDLLSDVLERRLGATCTILWGCEAVDTGDLLDPTSGSNLVLDESFDPSTEEAQLYMMDFCFFLFDQDFAIKPTEDYECGINLFDKWLKEQAAEDDPDEIYLEYCDGATGVPVAPEVFGPCMWQWNVEYHDDNFFSLNGVVKAMKVDFVIGVRYDSASSKMEAEWQKIENWLTSEMKTYAPKEISNAFFSNKDFLWHDTQMSVLNTAKGAAGIVMGVTAAALLINCRSIEMTLFSSISVLFVITSVITLLVLIGWELGFVEGVSFSIVIGVSVDFIVHFCHAYVGPMGDKDRVTRSRWTLLHMGPSVLAAALTTIVTVLPMLFSIFAFLKKFGAAFILTIIQAVVGSFVVFLAITICLGPSRPTHLVDRLFGKNKDDDTVGKPKPGDLSDSIMKGSQQQLDTKEVESLAEEIAEEKAILDLHDEDIQVRQAQSTDAEQVEVISEPNSLSM